eukprot:9433626-Pyramimonas_sp.AAC.1
MRPSAPFALDNARNLLHSCGVKNRKSAVDGVTWVFVLFAGVRCAAYSCHASAPRRFGSTPT